MKKLFLAILAAGTVVSAQAQKAGSILVYGNAGYTHDKSRDDDGLPGTSDVISKNNTWNFSPGIGYQINNHLTVGLNFSVGQNRMTTDNGVITEERKFTTFEVGPFVRMTMPMNKTFFVFHQLNASYMSGKGIFDDGVAGTPDVEETYKGFGVFWFPAVGVNFTKCMAFNLSFGGLGYNQQNWDMTGPQEVKNSEFFVNFGQTVNIGISANLGGRRHARGHSEPGMEHRHMDTSDDSEEDMPKRKRSSDVDE